MKLGFMSFFVKACVEALKEFPAVNAEIDGDDIVYKDFVRHGRRGRRRRRGLVVPVIRDADPKGFADIEKAIGEYGSSARDGKLTLEELTGGTFTITNGGVYGSLMSTPIVNPPQSGILGMHKIQERPMVVDGQIVIRPMMYLALSYDHRIVDGREAVSFLVRVKEGVEDPAPLAAGGVRSEWQATMFRPDRHRLRPRRLHCGHSRGSARHERRVRREQTRRSAARV